MSGLGPLAVLLLAGAAPAQGVRWQRDVDTALKQARRLDRPLMVDFWAAWCGWCRRLSKETYVDPEVVRLSEEFVAVRVDTEGNAREIEMTERYAVSSLPTVAFLSPEGRLLLRVDGFQGPGAFPDTMRKAREVAERIMPFEEALRRDAGDPLALTRLGQHAFEQGSPEESRELLQKAVKRDPELPSRDRKRSRLFLALIQREERKYAQAESLFKEALALRPPDGYDAKLLLMLGLTYADWHHFDDARATLRQVIADHPYTPVAQKARETLIALDRR